MAREEFTVRVTKKGEIFVELDGLPARRVKDLIQYFEETLGPARLVESEGGDTPGRVELEEEIIRQSGQEEENEEHSQDRMRLREE